MLQSDPILERMMRLHPKVIDLSLDRVYQLLEHLGNPHKSLPPVVHIAGTNGKGSTLAMLSAMLKADGAQVHRYVSPHLVRFHERILIRDKAIGEPELVEVLGECEEVNGGKPITYFEITTCAAFLAFSRSKADYLLLETGLGGRLDATNVVDKPELCLISPISLDHQAFLGSTIAQIAFEKAGIIKNNVPIFCGPQPDDAARVLREKAAVMAAPLEQAGFDWQVEKTSYQLLYQCGDVKWELPLPSLEGHYQADNAGLAIHAARHLNLGISVVSKGLLNVTWPGRLQYLKEGQLAALLGPDQELWVDGGHNPAGAEGIAKFLRERAEGRIIHMIFGMLNSKDASAYFEKLHGLNIVIWPVAIDGEPNSFKAANLKQAAEHAGLRTQMAENVRSALNEIAKEQQSSMVLITGSLYLVGRVLGENA